MESSQCPECQERRERERRERIDKAAKEVVAKAPPLSDEQRRELANLLRPLP